MNAKFTIYEGKPNARAVGPQVSISKDGRLSLNKVASAIFDKEPVEKVLLGWDASNTSIALLKINKKDARARTVRYGGEGRGVGFNAKDFLENFVGFEAQGFAFQNTRSCATGQRNSDRPIWHHASAPRATIDAYVPGD